MPTTEKLKLIDFRGRPPTAEFNSYFTREGTTAVNYKVGAKYVSPAFIANSVDLFLEEMATANIVRTVALAGMPRRSIPNRTALSPTTIFTG